MKLKALGAVFAALLTFAPGLLNAQQSALTGIVHIGTFDSRGVAVAWGRSDAFRARLAELTQMHDDAKAKGNTALADSLEAVAVEMQDRLHRQVFGTAPIPDIMNELKEDLPRIAEEAQVDIILNVWEIPYMRENLNTKDITLHLAEKFNPSDETTKIIHRLKDTPPVRLDEQHHDH